MRKYNRFAQGGVIHISKCECNVACAYTPNVAVGRIWKMKLIFKQVVTKIFGNVFAN